MGTMLEGSIVNIFMELIPGGTIETLLKTFGPFEENLFRNFTNQMMEGISYLHSKNVVHRYIMNFHVYVCHKGILGGAGLGRVKLCKCALICVDKLG